MKAKLVLESLNENQEWSESFKNVKSKIEKSKSLPKEMKEEILKKVITAEFGTQYRKGVVSELKGSPGRDVV